MPPPTRRRPADVDDDEDEVSDQERHGAPSGARSSDDEGSDVEEGEPMAEVQRDDSSEAQLVKKLVRYALACEYSRTPIRRDGIKEKVLGEHGRAFKKVFARAQAQLIAVFGMEMVEMPTKDRSVMSLDQKRKATKSQSQAPPSSNAYILVSTLPAAYRVPAILAPSAAQSPEGEASYVGLYSTLVSAITLAGGELSDAKFRRYLQRLVVDKNMPSLNPNNKNQPTESTEFVLQRMIRQGYLVKVAENKTQGDDDSITWHVGPRGKVEVGNEAIASIVRLVYGGSTPELEEKLKAALKVSDYLPAGADQDGVAQNGIGRPQGDDGADEAGPSEVRRSRRRRRVDDHDDDD